MIINISIIIIIMQVNDIMMSSLLELAVVDNYTLYYTMLYYTTLYYTIIYYIMI